MGGGALLRAGDWICGAECSLSLAVDDGDVRFSSRLTGEVVYFPYIRLNRSAHFQHVLERAKVEYAPSKAWKLGAGYGAYQYGGQPWQNKPFVTTTLGTNVGSFEFWLQKMPGGAQVQLRYQLTWD